MKNSLQVSLPTPLSGVGTKNILLTDENNILLSLSNKRWGTEHGANWEETKGEHG